MAALNIEPNLGDADGFYEALIDTHRGLTPEQSHALNARLVLLLANHVGDITVLREALARAHSTLSSAPPPLARHEV